MCGGARPSRFDPIDLNADSTVLLIAWWRIGWRDHKRMVLARQLASAREGWCSFAIRLFMRMSACRAVTTEPCGREGCFAALFHAETF